MSVSSVRRTSLGCLGLIAGVLFGCSGGPHYPCTSLQGSVAVDGKPLATGSIRFLPQETGQGPAVGGVIADGRYQVDDVPLGSVRALLGSVRKGKELPSPDGLPRWETENLIPSRYREGILIEVTGGQREQDFDLQSE